MKRYRIYPVALKARHCFVQELQYMHTNPVRKGFVESPEDLKYCIARNWINEDDSIIRINKLNSVFFIEVEAT